MKQSCCFIVMAVLAQGCCTAEKQNVRQIDNSHELIIPKYIKYVEADPKFAADLPARTSKIEKAKLLSEFVKGIVKADRCPERTDVAKIELDHVTILSEYVAYVEADTTLKPEQKDDKKKLVASLKRLVDSLKQSLGN